MGRNLKLLKRINFWISDYFSVIRQGIGIIGRDNVNLLASGMVYSRSEEHTSELQSQR